MYQQLYKEHNIVVRDTHAVKRKYTYHVIVGVLVFPVKLTGHTFLVFDLCSRLCLIYATSIIG